MACLGRGSLDIRFNTALIQMFGGSDGVRTRGLRVKSPSLYLAKLQTRMSVREGIYNKCDYSF